MMIDERGEYDKGRGYNAQRDNQGVYMDIRTH